MNILKFRNGGESVGRGERVTSVFRMLSSGLATLLIAWWTRVSEPLVSTNAVLTAQLTSFKNVSKKVVEVPTSREQVSFVRSQPRLCYPDSPLEHPEENPRRDTEPRWNSTGFRRFKQSKLTAPEPDCTSQHPRFFHLIITNEVFNHSVSDMPS